MNTIIHKLVDSVRWVVSVYLALLVVCCVSCNKSVHIPPPANSITTSQVFSDSSDLAAAISGIYSQIEYANTGGIGFCNGAQTIWCGVSADELVPSDVSADAQKFYINELASTSGIVLSDFWIRPYNFIYQANASIEGLQASKVADSVKNHYLGEAKFLRALFYFYMVNTFGDVPNVTSTAFAKTSLYPRAPKSEIYQQILSDLKDAQTFLPADYSYSGGQRTRANRWAATALLARVYLYTGDWADAIAQSGALINEPMYGLSGDLNAVFSPNSTEAILQWRPNTDYLPFDATAEGAQILPVQGLPPAFYVSPQLLSAFEPNDQRRIAWVDSVNSDGVDYFVPYKYKVGQDQHTPGGTPTEYYTVLRLAEQYLIRAEAKAQQQDVSGATDDLNIIRSRAGLPAYAGATDQASVLSAIMHERQIELFAEWGHRWYDLKRTGEIDAVMSVVTPQKVGGSSWNTNQQLFPIPLNELGTDPNLTQNPGY